MEGIYWAESIRLPLGWLTALATSEVRLALWSMREVYGVVRFCHLVGMATFVGMVLLLDLRGLGLFPPGALEPVRTRLGLVLNVAFWVTIGTGLLLFLRDPVGTGLHSMFLPKLVLVVLGWMQATATRRLPLLRRSAGARQVGASVSLVIWLLVIGASTWNHVERPVRVGAALRLQNTGK